KRWFESVFICVHLRLGFWFVLFKPRKTRNVAKRKELLSRVLAFFAVQNNGSFYLTTDEHRWTQIKASETMV
ncbi:MAG: hypothetical protein LBC18_12945, partial [Opitutaceae bacterium]|nr:hypothetical protein [Opitutaceae bacterium]